MASAKAGIDALLKTKTQRPMLLEVFTTIEHDMEGLKF
jgi:hypothetical protein